METTTLIYYANGNTYDLTFKNATQKEDGKQYIFIDDNLCEVISMVKTNKVTIDWQPTFD